MSSGNFNCLGSDPFMPFALFTTLLGRVRLSQGNRWLFGILILSFLLKIIELAESGEEALEIFAELREEEIEIPLIISHQMMREMKGDELLLQIHARTSTGKRSRRMCQPRQKRIFVQMSHEL